MSTAPASGASARPSVIQLNIKEKAALYAAYISVFTEGGLFIPTVNEHRLGDDIYVLVTLPGDPQRYPIVGKVAWITPARSTANRTQGIGIRFPKNDDKAKQLRSQIELALGHALQSERPTQTV